MDDYKKIPFDDPDLCVPDLDDFDQMKEFFLDCAAKYFRYLSSDDMEKMLAALGKRVDVLATPTDDVFISVSPDAVLRQYPDITIDEAIQIRDNACENIWESGGQSDLDEIVWDQIGAEYKSIKSDSHRGLSSYPGDIVLDNACGSGSFCVAAVLEGRSFIGIEKNEDVALFKKRPVDYIDVCNQRIKEAKRTFETEQQAIS